MHPTRIFKKPEELSKAFEEYKKDVEKQSKEWLNVQYVGKDGERKADGLKVPYTLEGFERFARNNYGCIEQYFKNQGDLYDNFVPVCSQVRKEIRENQIIGGMLGVFNPSITQRLNGLADKTETKDTTEPRVFNI